MQQLDAYIYIYIYVHRSIQGTHPRFGLANRFFVGEGTAVPADDAEDESSPSSWPLSWSGYIGEADALFMPGWSRIGGASGGSLASFALAKDFCRSLMDSRLGKDCELVAKEKMQLSYEVIYLVWLLSG